MSLLADLPVGAVVGIDSVVFIYFIEEHTRYESVISGFFEDRLEHGSNRAITSVITLAEVLVQPKRIGRADLVQEYRDILAEGPNIVFADITSQIAERGAALRAQYGVRLPDALQIAASLAQLHPIFREIWHRDRNSPMIPGTGPVDVKCSD